MLPTSHQGRARASEMMSIPWECKAWPVSAEPDAQPSCRLGAVTSGWQWLCTPPTRDTTRCPEHRRLRCLCDCQRRAGHAHPEVGLCSGNNGKVKDSQGNRYGQPEALCHGQMEGAFLGSLQGALQPSREKEGGCSQGPLLASSQHPAPTHLQLWVILLECDITLVPR